MDELLLKAANLLTEIVRNAKLPEHLDLEAKLLACELYEELDNYKPQERN